MAFQTDFKSQLKNPKQKRLLIIAGVFFVAAGIIVYRVFFSSPASPPVLHGSPASSSAGGQTSAKSPLRESSSGQVPPRTASSRAGLGAVRESDIKRIRLDTDIVKSQLFKELKIYSKDNPVTVPEKGNPDPFRRPLNAPPVFSATSTPEVSPSP